MPTSTAELCLPQAERVLFKMCKHFAIKVPVDFDSQRAEIDFRFGRCHIRREGERLRLHCEAGAPEQLSRVQAVLDEHLALMARDRELSVAWQAA